MRAATPEDEPPGLLVSALTQNPTGFLQAAKRAPRDIKEWVKEQYRYGGERPDLPPGAEIRPEYLGNRRMMQIAQVGETALTLGGGLLEHAAAKKAAQEAIEFTARHAAVRAEAKALEAASQKAVRTIDLGGGNFRVTNDAGATLDYALSHTPQETLVKIRNVFVPEAERKSGIGSSLYRAVGEEAAKAGKPISVQSNVVSQTPEAIAKLRGKLFAGAGQVTPEAPEIAGQAAQAAAKRTAGNVPEGYTSQPVAGGGLPFKPVEDVLLEAEMSGTAPRARNLRLDKINSAYDMDNAIKQEMLNVTRVHGLEVKAARRGVITHQETREAAESILGDPAAAAKLLASKRGQALNAEELLAMRNVNIEAIKHMHEMAKKVAADPDNLPLHAEFVASINRQLSLQYRLHGAAAEAGRALDSLKILSTGMFDKEKLAFLKAGTFDPAKLAKTMADMTPEALAKTAKKAVAPTLWDKLYELRIASNLYNPAIHGRNVISNAMKTAEEAAVLTTEGALDLAIRPFTRKQGTSLMAGSDYVSGLKAGVGEGIDAFRAVMRSGGEGLDPFAQKIERLGLEKAKSFTKFDTPEGFAIAGKAGQVIRGSSRILGAEDQIFKSINFSGSLHQQAIGKLRAAGTPITSQSIEVAIKTADKAMLERAHQAALEGTFTNAGAFSKFVNSIRTAKLGNTQPGKWLIMFSRTAANIAQQATERAPISGQALALFRTLRRPAGEKLASAPKEFAPSTLWLGTLAGLYLSGLVDSGSITGGRPTGASLPSAAEQFPRAAGWKPYSIKVGDAYINYDRFDPIGQNLAGIADAKLAMEAGDSGQASSILTRALSNMLLRGSPLGDIMEYMSSLEDPTKKLPQLAGQQVASFLPGVGALRAAASATDPFQRETRGFAGQIESAIPGIRSRFLEKKLDKFGRPVEAPLGERMLDLAGMRTRSSRPEEMATLQRAEQLADMKREVSGTELAKVSPQARLDRLLKAREFLDRSDMKPIERMEALALRTFKEGQPGTLPVQERKELHALDGNVAKGLFAIYSQNGNDHERLRVMRWALARGLRINWSEQTKKLKAGVTDNE